MPGTAHSLKAGLKNLRAMPLINAPVTWTIRWSAGLAGVTPEFAIEHLPHSGVTRMRLPNGRRARMWSRGDDWVSNQVFWRGWDGYDTEVASLFWHLSSNAEVTLDIGAHVGFYAILAATANPHARVVAMEPLPVVFERLQRNIRLNHLRNVTLCREAAGAVDGTAEFFYLPGMIPSSSSLSETFMRDAPEVTSSEVKVVRIDTLAEAHGLTTIDLVKIDTETTEPDVLVGMGDLLDRNRPHIICEVLTRVDVDALESTLKPLGYEFYLLTDGGPQRRETIRPDPRWLNYIFTARASACFGS